MSESNVEVKIGGDASGALLSMAEVRHALQGLSNPLRGIYSDVGELAEGFAAAFAVEKIAEFVEKMAELGTETERTAAILGVTTEEVGRLSLIAAATGTSSEGMSMAMERFNLNLSRARSGTGPAADALRALGLTAEQFIGVPIPQQLDLLSEKISKFADGGNKTAIVMALLGRTGAQMIPVLDQGRAGFDELGAAADRAGTALSKSTVDGLVETHHNLVEFGASVEGASVSIFSEFIPAANGLLRVLSDLGEDFVAAMNKGGMLKDTFDLLAYAVDGVVIAIAYIAFAMKQTWNTVEAIVDSMGHDFIGLGKAIYDALHFNFAAARDDIINIPREIVGTWKGWLGNLTDEFKEFRSELNAITGGGESDAKPEAPKLRNAPAMTDQNMASAAAARIEGQIKAEQALLEQKKNIYEQEAATFQITQNEKFALLETATQKEYQSELDLLHKEAQIGGLSVQQRQQVLSRIAQLEAKHRADMIKLDTQSIQEMQKQWMGFFNSLQSSFNSQLKGMLAGTESFKQGMLNILGDLLIQFIEWAEKMGFQWLATQIAMTTASTTGAAERATAEATAKKAGQAADYASDVAQVERNAVLVFGGVFANLAPFLGPAAAGPAGASQAAVAATVGELAPPLETGAWSIPGEMLARLHPNEMVVPADFASGLRANGTLGGTGGSENHYHISAVDAQSFVNLLQSNRAAVGEVVTRFAKDNPTKFKGA